MNDNKKQFVKAWRYELPRYNYALSVYGPDGFNGYGYDKDGYDPYGQDEFGFDQNGDFIFRAPEYLAKELGTDRVMVINRSKFVPIGFAEQRRYIHVFDDGSVLVVFHKTIVRYDPTSFKDAVRFKRVGSHRMQLFSSVEDYSEEMSRRGWAET